MGNKPQIKKLIAPAPGPWLVYDDFFPIINFYDKETDRKLDIAALYTDVLSPEMAQANARLIGAAPKLLENLRAAVVELHNRRQRTHKSVAGLCPIVVAAEEAIAEAEYWVAELPAFAAEGEADGEEDAQSEKTYSILRFFDAEKNSEKIHEGLNRTEVDAYFEDNTTEGLLPDKTRWFEGFEAE